MSLFQGIKSWKSPQLAQVFLFENLERKESRNVARFFICIAVIFVLAWLFRRHENSKFTENQELSKIHLHHIVIQINLDVSKTRITKIIQINYEIPSTTQIKNILYKL